jgi:hypothetical protein
MGLSFSTSRISTGTSAKFLSNYIEDKLKFITSNSIQLISILSDLDVYLCGGALTSIASESEISDYDLYFKSVESVEAVKDFLCFGNPERTLYTTSCAYTITSTEPEFPRLQLIRRDDLLIKSTIEDKLSMFDFTVCMAAYRFKHSFLTLEDYFLADLSTKLIHFNLKTSNPVNSLHRVVKYLRKGFRIYRHELCLLLNAADEFLLYHPTYKPAGYQVQLYDLLKKCSKIDRPYITKQLVSCIKFNKDIDSY